MRDAAGRLARLERILVGLLTRSENRIVGLEGRPVVTPDVQAELAQLIGEVRSHGGAICKHCGEHFDHDRTCAMLSPTLSEGVPDPFREPTVLSADNPNRKPLGFTVRQYCGSEVFPYVKEDHPNGVDRKKLETIKTRGALTEGLEILVPSLFGDFHIMTVSINEVGEPSVKDEHTMAVLEFGKDDRECWVCIGLVNMKSIKKLELKS